MNIYEEAWKNIVKPPQIKAKMTALGPKQRVVQNKNVYRIDLTVTNRNGKMLSGYLFHSPEVQSHQTIIYLHGNGGSKLEAMPLVELIPSFGLNLAAFDLPGCGNSDPQTLSYGVNQVFDIRDMLQEVRKHIKVRRVILWGRSMGSLCAIMFADMYSYEVKALILDSPFRFLSGVIERIASKKVQLPLFMLKPILYLIQQRAAKEVGFDLFSIDYLSILKKLNSHLPILFIFSNFDSIVPAQQVLQFFNAYRGPKDLCEIYRTHDEDRPQDLFRQGAMWITRAKRNNYEAIKQARQQLIERKRQKQFEDRNLSQNVRYCKSPQHSRKDNCW